jgi:PKD repeat protein
MDKKRLAVTAALVCAAVVLALASCTLFQHAEAVIAVNATSGTVPFTITYDGGGSTGVGEVTYYHWAFGTGDEDSGATGTYTYQQAGTFTLELLVRDESGDNDTATVTITVEPAVWLTDENLDRVYRLSMDGTELGHFDLPVKEPRGVTIAEVGGKATLVISCANEGFQRLVYLDPATGAVKQTLTAPGQSPLQITYGAAGQKQLWHVDGLTRKIFRLNPADAQVYESYGQTYFKSTSPEVRDVPFLWTPQGLDWTPHPPTLGRLWYLEGETHLLYEIEMIAGYDIMSNTQLEIAGDPVELPEGIFPVKAIDMVDGYLWAIDVDRHRIVEIDPETGALTGEEITGFPGSAPSGLEIQH